LEVAVPISWAWLLHPEWVVLSYSALKATIFMEFCRKGRFVAHFSNKEKQMAQIKQVISSFLKHH